MVVNLKRFLNWHVFFVVSGLSDSLTNGPSAQRTVTLARFPRATTYNVGEHDCKVNHVARLGFQRCDSRHKSSSSSKGESQSSSTDLKLQISAENENRPHHRRRHWSPPTMTGVNHIKPRPP
ncbi:hypothetical protein F0562_005697 [Nyssa sinensis]|uniref:Secreted protein n=1 Tax=Nyssa sinensis TaxID=561372 RepID=A0A5J5AJ32_9ASTE|nr:hypothetical protein F0562_005697 [Nyssa sinensis]